MKVVTSHNGRFYQVVSSPFLCQSNQPSGNVLIFRDMTEEEKLQRMKEDLTHMIVHDLKNPLAATMAYIETILSGAIGELLEKQEDFLKRAYNNSNFLLNMICDILDIYKIEEEGVELHIMRESLVVPITHAIHQLEGEQIAKNISVNVDFGDLPNIPFDCKMVTRVCANLLHNAYKFTPTGGDIDVRLYTDDAFHCVQIQDYGLGIPQKYRKKVFDKFAQVGNDGIKSRFSSGIGLAFCKLVIEAHHGKIWVDSGMKKGSAFTFRLPIHQEKEKVTL
ncbi:MAG: hypothetical protein B6244_08690 [Candidatus Cloacimonetes bacterium 4572_55]|nr:MAG: hypothetical protein B6244_08690 [Candidatus Cloacimonetes bacterium 4572_55]